MNQTEVVFAIGFVPPTLSNPRQIVSTGRRSRSQDLV